MNKAAASEPFKHKSPAKNPFSTKFQEAAAQAQAQQEPDFGQTPS